MKLAKVPCLSLCHRRCRSRALSKFSWRSHHPALQSTSHCCRVGLTAYVKDFSSLREDPRITDTMFSSNTWVCGIMGHTLPDSGQRSIGPALLISGSPSLQDICGMPEPDRATHIKQLLYWLHYSLCFALHMLRCFCTAEESVVALDLC